MKILSFGEIIWDVYPDKRCIGGAPLNFAAHAVRSGSESYLLSAVGGDELGREALKIIDSYGVSTKFVSLEPTLLTGQCRVTLSESGVPRYDILEDVAYDHISVPDNIENEHFDAFAFGTLALRGDDNRKAVSSLLQKCDFSEIFVDLNLRAPFYSPETIRMGLENATILKVSDEELPEVLRWVLGEKMEKEEGVRALSDNFSGIKLIILTCGAKGSAAYECEKRKFTYCKAKKTEVVSTVGAGDSYGATFLISYLSGKSICECLERATEVSAFVVSRAEAIPKF